jgi:hypothetical protein
VAPACALAAAATGCQSSQELNKTLAKQGSREIAAQHGLVIKGVNHDVRVVHTGVVTDSNGTAAAVVLRNVKSNPLGAIPIAINVEGAGGKSVFRNSAPGLEPSLTSIAALPGHGELTWVNDQVVSNGATASAVRATLGAGGAGAPATLPQIDISPPHLMNDPYSGLEAVGKITNSSQVTQLKLFIYISAWQGNRLIAAGRGAIQRLLPHAHANYHVFLIGDPHGAPLTIAAPPTVLR